MFTAKFSLLKFHSFPIILPSKMSHFGRCLKISWVVKWSRHLLHDSSLTEESFCVQCRKLIFITQLETNFLPTFFSTIRTVTSLRNFQARSQNREKQLLISLRLSVRPDRTRLSLERFSWNLVLEHFRKFVRNFKVNFSLTIIMCTLHEGAGIAQSV